MMLTRAGTTIVALLAACVIGLVGCNQEPASPQPSAPPEKPGQQTPRETASGLQPTAPPPPAVQDLKPLQESDPKPFTHVFLGHSIFLEVLEEKEEKAIASTLAGLLSQTGSIIGLNGAASVGARQFFVWQPRDMRAGKRRVFVDAEVCLREGYLEHLLSYSSKSHESILTSDFDARILHLALEATGARRGKPVQFFDERGREKFRAPSGDPIRVLVRYQDKDGRIVTRPAQQWVVHRKSKKILEHDWVFAGSYVYKNADGEEVYAASASGRLICVANFVQALLDVPIPSSELAAEGYEFGCHTDLIPPLETKVAVIFEPAPRK